MSWYTGSFLDLSTHLISKVMRKTDLISFRDKFRVCGFTLCANGKHKKYVCLFKSFIIFEKRKSDYIYDCVYDSQWHILIANIISSWQMVGFLSTPFGFFMFLVLLSSASSFRKSNLGISLFNIMMLNSQFSMDGSSSMLTTLIADRL